MPLSPSTRRHLSGLCLTLAVLVSACGESPDQSPPQPRLVVLYATCSLNKDFLSPYNPAVEYTPNLDQFAQEGRVFLKHQTETGVSGPAFASIVTGTQADRHRVYNHPKPLAEELYLVSEAFRDNGYEGFFWSGHPMASASLGYGQGILPANVTATKGSGNPDDHQRLTGNDEQFNAILDRLKSDPEYKAYLQFTFTLTHTPYHTRTTDSTQITFAREYKEHFTGFDPRDADRLLGIYTNNALQLTWNFAETVKRLDLSKKDISQLAALLDFYYRAAIFELDRQFGAFLEKIRDAGLDDQSLVTFTTDHGEILYRENAHFKWTHGKQLCPEVFNIPWILWSPGGHVPPGTFDGVTRSIDLFPTMAGICQLTLPDDFVFAGQDLSPAIQGRAGTPELLSYSHTSMLSLEEHDRSADLDQRRALHPRPDPALMWTMIRDGDLVYKMQRLREGEWQTHVFDWSQDPGENHDLFDATDPTHMEMSRRLLDYRRQLVEAYQDVDGVLNRLSEEERLERLRSLGYIN